MKERGHSLLLLKDRKQIRKTSLSSEKKLSIAWREKGGTSREGGSPNPQNFRVEEKGGGGNRGKYRKGEEGITPARGPDEIDRRLCIEILQASPEEKRV